MTDTLADGAVRSRAANRELIEVIIAQVGGSLRHIRCTASARLLREGVSMTHLYVLWQLEEHGELAMHRMADLLGVSMSNLTGLVDRMEERALVERVRPADDRRVVRIRPTLRGLEVARMIEVVRSDLVEAVLTRLDDRQLGRLAATVADIRGALVAEPPLIGTDAECAPPTADGNGLGPRADKETPH